MMRSSNIIENEFLTSQELINFVNDVCDGIKLFLTSAVEKLYKNEKKSDELKHDIFAFLIVGITFLKQKYPTKYGKID